jgi:hypothetical protein
MQSSHKFLRFNIYQGNAAAAVLDCIPVSLLHLPRAPKPTPDCYDGAFGFCRVVVGEGTTGAWEN